MYNLDLSKSFNFYHNKSVKEYIYVKIISQECCVTMFELCINDYYKLKKQGLFKLYKWNKSKLFRTKVYVSVDLLKRNWERVRMAQRQSDMVCQFGTAIKWHGASLWHEVSFWHRGWLWHSDKMFKLYFF